MFGIKNQSGNVATLEFQNVATLKRKNQAGSGVKIPKWQLFIG
jgi:hypothetical protein